MSESIQYSETIKQFIVDNFLFGDATKLSVDTLLFEKGIIDSTGILELVAFIEDNFKVIVEDDELVQDNFSSINSMDKFLQTKNNQVTSN